MFNLFKKEIVFSLEGCPADSKVFILKNDFSGRASASESARAWHNWEDKPNGAVLICIPAGAELQALTAQQLKEIGLMRIESDKAPDSEA